VSWFYQDTVFSDPTDYWGFVYVITDLILNKKYIGKKQFWFKKTKIQKGKKKRYLIESDWKEYYSSSSLLQEQVKINGADSFKREILKLCKNKSECSYYEAYYQFKFEVLQQPDMWYNEWISCRITRKHLLGK
jgi:hypothetical protein